MITLSKKEYQKLDQENQKPQQHFQQEQQEQQQLFQQRQQQLTQRKQQQQRQQHFEYYQKSQKIYKLNEKKNIAKENLNISIILKVEPVEVIVAVVMKVAMMKAAI